MSRRFYFGGSDDDSGSDLDGDASLPFPKPLDRAAFLAPDFDATTFLSTLSTSNRFQTLDDLQTELRDLSQSLNKELVDLVNDNYQDFLSLGSTLRGGEVRVEEVRVGMLGFQRNIAGVKAALDARRREVAALIEQKRAVKKDISMARSLLEIAERMEDLEEKLGVSRTASSHRRGQSMEDEQEDDAEDTASDESDEEDDVDQVSPKLRRRVEEYLIVKLLMDEHEQHPSVLSQRERLRTVRSAVQVELETAMKQGAGEQARQDLTRLRTLIDGR